MESQINQTQPTKEKSLQKTNLAISTNPSDIFQLKNHEENIGFITIKTLKLSTEKLNEILHKNSEAFAQNFNKEIKQLANEEQTDHDDLAIHQSFINQVPLTVFPAIITCSDKSLKAKFIRHRISEQSMNFSRFFAHIQFSNLITLNLSEKSITSIQPLAWLVAPKLRCLQLYLNPISSLKSLVKGDFPKLQMITFYHNPIFSLEQIYRSNSNKLCSFEFDCQYTSEHRVQNYGFLFKLKHIEIKTLKVQDSRRIDVRKRAFFKIINEQFHTQMMLYNYPRRIRRID